VARDIGRGRHSNIYKEINRSISSIGQAIVVLVVVLKISVQIVSCVRDQNLYRAP
jgi:hypothetical protein